MTGYRPDTPSKLLNLPICNGGRLRRSTTPQRKAQRDGLIKECDALKDELARVEFSAQTQKIITTTIAEITGKIHGATFAKKPYVMDKLDVQLVLRHDDAGRWLEGTCGLGDFTISAASSARC